MIQNVTNKPVAELFSSENQVSYFIPKYQREYIWSKFNWESLFDDIDESVGGHFLGSIICINTQLDSHRAAELELVDGQQRTTTISLLYLALYKYFLENMPADDEEAKHELFSFKKKIVLQNKTPRVTPSYTASNLDDYNWIFFEVLGDGVNKPPKKPKFLGLRRMYKAFDYFYDRLNENDDDGNSLFTYQKAQGFLSKLNSATIVKIDVIGHSDAFTLFETLNNRGVPLSAVDLIKNKLLGKLEKNAINDGNNTKLDENYKRWSSIVANLSEEYSTQERFLRQFYNAFKVDPDIEVKKTPKAMKSNLIMIYEELIDRDATAMLEKLEECSEIYSNNIDYNNNESPKELVYALRNLENVNGADAYMLLMFLDKKFGINSYQKIQIIMLLCKYFIRRNVTDYPNTRNLTNYFIDIIEELNGLEKYDFEKTKEIFLRLGRPANDELFANKLKGNVYEENVGAVRYILSSIELNETQTDEIYTNFYERDKKKFKWTIEHILPQGDNIPKEWVKMIANGDENLAKEIKTNLVHKLGNLTLTGYNSKLSNMSFERKKTRQQDGKSIGYLNGLWLNSRLKERNSWTADEIEERTELLVEKAIKLFSF
ncbi:MAG: DUF262 domain-containing HNH endonuclease family protein [Bacteroidetes bacterium]|nr:DUF262 domain-containing HNH endonuclease family protein [Bacteroidota bacterium]